jgi:phenylpropionate dioxygenase-like ring-hydroxylating dioxygenase large terminal subunit
MNDPTSATTRLAPGAARSPGLSYQQLLDTDTHEVPAVLRIESAKYLGSEDVDIRRYITREWHEQEKEHIWKKAWQFACREEHIPNVGDHIVYEIAGMSYIVIRGSDGAIRAYPNACLHRGRRLKDYSGNCSEIRCAFHGFAWTIDGSLLDVPARWDFPHVEDENFSLPACKVGTWAGFVMINPDCDAEPLEDFLGGIVDQFADWDLENAYVEAHVARVIPANWKVVQEAFSEAYHVNATHPQILTYLGDTNSQVDIWENFSRVITPGGTPSPLLDASPTETDMLRAMLDVRVDMDMPVELPEGMSMRAFAASLARKRWSGVAPERSARMSDAELMDSIDYTVFPNFHPWGAFNRIVYRFRPNGDDHRSAIMECIFLSPFTGERPKPAPIHWLEDHETFSDATELGMLGKVFDQDLFNMPKVQLGLETTQKPGITLANYQESKVRWIHQKLGEWVEKGQRGERVVTK